MVKSHPGECPFVDRLMVADGNFNRTIEYEDDVGSYLYYCHRDAVGAETLVQYCKLQGRKRDPFECLNKGEWEACFRYRAGSEGVRTCRIYGERKNDGTDPR